MQALYYTEILSPWTVGDVAPPHTADSDVVIDMAYAGLNPIDMLLWQGVGGLQPPTPHVPGVEGAGWLDGKPVMLFGHGLGVKRWGTAADRVSVAPDAIFAVPQGLDLASAAVCGASGGTAMRIFELAQANAGECVMVYGAGGNVGFMLTSLLSQAGVHVLGQVRDPAKAGMVERAGGEPLVASDASEIVRQLGGVNPVAIADPLGGAWTQAAVDAAAVGGRILNYGALAGPMTLDTRAFYRKGLILRGYSGLSEPEAHARCVGLALQAAADNRIEVQAILRTFRLARGAEAFEALRSGATGKVVVALNGAG